MSSGSESEDSSDKEKYKNDNYKSPSKKKRQKKGAVNKVSRNYCFEIPLLESDSNKFTEVSFLDLVAREDVKAKKINTPNGAGAAAGLNPNASDDEDALKALAAKYEAKYAEPAGKPKTKKRKLEYDDIGEGYDESDPFIDNSECFDEVVPQEMTTAHGGFYINTGSLEFKANDKAVYELSSDEEDNEEKKEKNPKKVPKKKVQFKEGKEIKLKKAKVIVTDVKRKARIINTDKNKRGPKVINTDSKKLEVNGKTEVKSTENSKEKTPEESVPKPPEIIDLEAQLDALSNASDLSKGESSSSKPTSIAKTSKSNGTTNIPKSTVPATKQKTPPVPSPAVTLAQKNTPAISKSEVKMTLVTNLPKTTKTATQRVNPPKTSQTATLKTSAKTTTAANSPPKAGWQNQVSFPPNLDVTISSINGSTSLAKLPGGVSVTTVTKTINCPSRTAIDLTVSSQEQRSAPVNTPMSVSLDKSNPASALNSPGAKLSASSKAVESAYSRIIGGNSAVSPAQGDKQPRSSPDKLTASVGNKPSTAAAVHKPAAASVGNKQATTAVSSKIATSVGNKAPSSLGNKASTKLGNSQTSSANMFQHDPANILSGSPDMSSILGTTAPYFQQKLLQQKTSNPDSSPVVLTSATGAPKSSPSVGAQSGYYTSPVKSSEPATRFPSSSQNSPVSAATKTTAQQKADQNLSSNKAAGSDISQQIGRQTAAKLYQQMGGDRSPTSTSRSTPDQSKKVSSSSNQKQSQAPSTNLKQPQPPTGASNPRQTAASMSLTPDMTNNLLRNAESMLNNLQQQSSSPTHSSQQQQAAYLAYQQHLASNSQKKAGGGQYDITNLLNSQPANTAQQQSNSRTSPNIRTNNTAASVAAATALLQQQQQQQQQSYFYNNFAFQ